MNRPEQNISYHILFLLSPIFIFLLFLLATLGGFGTLNQQIMVGDLLINIISVYAVLFLLICSYIFFSLRRLKLTSGWDNVIINGYSIGSSTFFAWIFLLPFIKKTVGMWNIEFLNMMVALILGYAAFFLLVGLYEVLSLFFTGQKMQS